MDSGEYDSAQENEATKDTIKRPLRPIPRRTKRKAPDPPSRPSSLTEDQMPGFVTEFHKAQEKTREAPFFREPPILNSPPIRPYEDSFPSLEDHFMKDHPTMDTFDVERWLSMYNPPSIRSYAMEPITEDFPITRGSTDLALRFRSRPTLSRAIQKPVEILPVVTERHELQPEKRPQLDRSDSIVTVAHLYEDLIVSKRFKIKVTLTNLTVVVLLAAIMLPNFAVILYGLFRLVFGTLFPAYYSYKAIRTKDVKEYVKWMMYWIVFAFFTCVETITDIFLAFWFPFYYEAKILVVLWLLSPATRGSSLIYRKFVHPWLTRREDEIDECISKAKQQGYSTVVELGTKGVNYATSIIMQTAIKGGGGLVNTLKRSYSASDVGEEGDLNRNVKALSHRAYDQPDFMEVEEEPRYRSESESHPRSRGQSMGRAARAAKVRSADISDVYGTEATEIIPQRRSPRVHDAMSREAPTPLCQEPPHEGLLPRKSKSRKAAGRTKSFTIGDARATRQALLDLQRESSLTSIPELSRGFSTLPRRATRSLRSRPTYVH